MTSTAPNVSERLADLRKVAETDTQGAARRTWTLFHELGTLVGKNRRAGEAALNALFEQGTPPQNLDGPTDGILVAPLVQPLLDKVAGTVTTLWMPWQGKRFDKANARGDNRLVDGARWPAKLLWPLYGTRSKDGQRVAFEFVTRIEPSADDQKTDVLVIDYGPVDSNPSLLIRSIRDELVEIVPGVYLGKILFRAGSSYTNIGFFALENAFPVKAEKSLSDQAVGLLEKTVEKGFGTVNSTAFRQVNRVAEWWKLPLPLALLNLRALRDDLREYNLYDTGVGADLPAAATDLPAYRTYDGSRTDPHYPEMGMVGSRFGRNAPIDSTEPEALPKRMEPSPREVAVRLLHRESFIPATTLNVLAAAWIQFQDHGWFGHGELSSKTFVDLPLDENDDWPEGSPMRIRTSNPDRNKPTTEHRPPAFRNTVTHWWDGSQIYGATEEANRRLRSGVDGKLAVDGDMLPGEDKEELAGLDKTGFNENYWVGLSLLHTLFVKEHNSICDHLKGLHPTWDDEHIFLTARLINAALIAKIHTVEWTPGILANPVLEKGMNANWYGILPRWIRDNFGHVGTEMIGGIVGSDLEHGAAPYSLTEEFVAVYRMHPLLPDDYEVRDHKTGELIDELDFDPMEGKDVRPTIEKYGWSNLLSSYGIANPGAITLKNHPKALTNHVRFNGDRVDLATIDVMRDRERGVARYNDFREKLRKPRLTKFEELSDDPKLVEEIRDVYDNDIDRVDLQVGMLAETPPPGFGFSDTAFRIFILMASRRLKSDRFFTNDYTPEVYTTEGLAWIEGNTMSDVLLRHHPELAPALEGVGNAFAPWNKV